MRKFLFVMAGLVISFSAVAKRDFAVYSELRCDNVKCYDKESGLPFSGQLRTFYDNGVVKANVEYKNGVRDGASNYYYFSGKERKQEVYTRGVIHGMLTEYHDNGNLKYEVEFDNGKKSGKFRSYYEDGTLKVDESYVDNKRNGRARKYNVHGDVMREAFFNDGVLVSGHCVSAEGEKITFTQNVIDAYNTKGLMPCDFERLVTF